LKRGSLKCGGKHYLKEEPGQRYRINRLKDNGEQFLLRRVDRYYCAKEILKTSDIMNYYVPIQ